MRRYTRIRVLILFLLELSVGLLVANCAASRTNGKYFKNGKRYGVIDETFRGEWFHYYKRGVSYAAGEFWEEAISDFQKAMSVTQRTVDKRNASTYGMHTIDYFPHRELGVIYYRIGEYEKSADELELSRSQCDTARARHYLDKARAALVASSLQDRTPPKIIITSGNVAKTKSFLVHVAGLVEDDTFVKSVLISVDAGGATISSERCYTATSQKTIAFRRQVRLTNGLNTIKIEAEDVSRKKSESVIAVEVDAIGPAISFDSPKDGEPLTSRDAVFRGVVFDKNGVESLSLNGEEARLARGVPNSFSHQLTLKDGLNTVSYVVRDKVGNETVGSLKVRVGRKKAEIKTPNKLLKLAAADVRQSRVPWTDASNTLRFHRFARPPFHPPFLALPESRTDTKIKPPPVIEVESPIIGASKGQEWPEFYGDELPCNVRIWALSGLKSIEINGQDRSENIIPKRIKQEFSQRIPLRINEQNEIRIVVRDNAGQEAIYRRTIKHVRWISQHQLLFQIQKIEGSGEIKGLESRRPERALITEIRNTRRFDAVGARSDASDVDALLRGWISEYENGTEVGIEIDVQSIKKRSLLPGPVTAYSENAAREEIEKMFRELAEKLVSEFPVVQGKITVAGKDDVEVSWGRKDIAEMLRLGYRLIIFRYDKNYRPQVTAYAEIQAFRGEKADADIFKNLDSASPRTGDLAITK